MASAAKVLDIFRIGELARAVDQFLAAFLALPVVGSDVLEAHGGGLPLVVGAENQRNILAVFLDRFENGQEFFLGLWAQ